jgi:hypothetical protein
MHKIQITLVPTPEPEGEIIPLALSTRTDFWEFPVATFSNGVFIYENKVVLSNNGSVLQILSKGSDGQITEALAENAFDLINETLKVMLIDTYDDGSEYKLRITAENLQMPSSSALLSRLYNPQLRIAEVSYLQGSNVVRELNFIGAEDIRMGFTARIIRRPGEFFQISNENGDISLKY